MLNRPADVAASALGPGRRAKTHVAGLATKLRGQDDLIAAPGQHLAKDLLRPTATAVSLRGVEQRDPGFDGRIDDRACLLCIQPAAEVVAAKPDHRTDDSRAANA